MSTFHLTVSSPDGNKFDGEVFKFDVRGVEGELAIMAGHIPFTTSVVNAPCAVWFDENTKKEIVDDVFGKFHDKFGFYPQSTSSYFLDAFTINYIKENIK